MLVSPSPVTLGRGLPGPAVKGEGIWAKSPGGEPWVSLWAREYGDAHIATLQCTMIARIVGRDSRETTWIWLFLLLYSNYTYFWYIYHILWHFNIFAVIKPCYWWIYQHDIFAMNIKHLLNYFDRPRYSVFHTQKVVSLSPSITHTKILPKMKKTKEEKT